MQALSGRIYAGPYKLVLEAHSEEFLVPVCLDALVRERHLLYNHMKESGVTLRVTPGINSQHPVSCVVTDGSIVYMILPTGIVILFSAPA